MRHAHAPGTLLPACDKALHARDGHGAAGDHNGDPGMNRTTGRLAAWALVLCTGWGAAGAAAAQVVVSQVYGGGGNSGATLRSDFIELRNTGDTAVSLDGWSVQYASSAGSSWQRTPLAGTIAPGGYYLVKQADGAGGTVDLPTPDATGTIAMAATNGKVALVNGGGVLSGTCPLDAVTLVDFVGFGSSANCFEGAGATATLSNTTAALRNGDGSVDTDDNGVDDTVLPEGTDRIVDTGDDDWE